jgi:hypothetical protein
MYPAINGARRTAVKPMRVESGGSGSIIDPGDVTSSPSGQAMPTANIAGWNISWYNDFLIQANEGQFLNVYGSSTYNAAQAKGNGRLGAYPVGYNDTRSKLVPPGDPTNYGHYTPNYISCSDSILKYNIKWVNGQAQSCCLIPKLSAVGKWGSVEGGRFSVRARADQIPTYKVAWLLWPRIGGNTSGATSGAIDPNTGLYIGGNGEIDWPEQDLDGEKTKFFMHRDNGKVNNDQYSAVAPSTSLNDAGWHTYTIEWLMGQSCKVFVDGVQVGVTQTSRVPSAAMDWKMQTETVLSSLTPLIPGGNGFVYYDWIAYWSPA